MHKFLIINGPNLNLLGSREPEKYGSKKLSEIETELQTWFSASHELRFIQSNHEGKLIDAIHDGKQWANGVIMNAGAYSHTSYALHDAITSTGLPTIEVHVTNVYAREPFRRTSVTAPACIGVIAGFGWHSYVWAIEALSTYLATRG